MLISSLTISCKRKCHAGAISLALGGRLRYFRGSQNQAGVNIMSRRCEICGKGGVRGNAIHRRGQAKKKGGIGQHVTAITPRVFAANLQTVCASINGATRRVKVCTKCLKSGRVLKAA